MIFVDISQDQVTPSKVWAAKTASVSMMEDDLGVVMEPGPTLEALGRRIEAIVSWEITLGRGSLAWIAR